MKPSNILSALKLLIDRQRPVFIWGAPGVGKSDLVLQVTKLMKLELKDLRTSLLDPTDLNA